MEDTHKGEIVNLFCNKRSTIKYLFLFFTVTAGYRFINPSVVFSLYLHDNICMCVLSQIDMYILVVYIEIVKEKEEERMVSELCCRCTKKDGRNEA